jgi:predicted regulator of Ras-like GTPase activity (Roadblock/LC7/MglB family)
MSEKIYVTALKNTLTEIKNISPNVKHSFIFTEDGTIVARDEDIENISLKKTVHFFQQLVEKANPIGGLKALAINGEKGKLYISRVNDMYLAVTTSTNADVAYLQSIVNVIVPTILKLLKTVAPTPLEFMPSQQFVVDNITGLFAGDNAQIDQERLMEWSNLFDGKNINEVEVESFRGKKTTCNVKKISDQKLQGKGLVLLPEKTCRTLEIKKGDFVKIKPKSS